MKFFILRKRHHEDNDFFSVFYEDSLIIHLINTLYFYDEKLSCNNNNGNNNNNNNNNRYLEWLAQKISEETFAIFAVFAFFRKSMPYKTFENSNCQKFISWNRSNFQFKYLFLIPTSNFPEFRSFFENMIQWVAQKVTLTKGNISTYIYFPKT